MQPLSPYLSYCFLIANTAWKRHNKTTESPVSVECHPRDMRIINNLQGVFGVFFTSWVLECTTYNP